MLNIHSTVGEWVAANLSNAAVMDVYGIDFCCGGQVSLADAAKTKGIDVKEIFSLLNTHLNHSAQSDPNQMPIDILVDYIVAEFHAELRENTPVIISYLDKVVNAHSTFHPELKELRELVRISLEDLALHMQKEEKILFPLAKEGKDAFILQPILVMEKEHVAEGERLHRITALSNNFVPPPDACSSYKYLYQLLSDFQKRLHLHIHIENNILFPKIKALFTSN